MNTTPFDEFLYWNENKNKKKKMINAQKKMKNIVMNLNKKLLFNNKRKNSKVNNEEKEEDNFLDDYFEIGNSIAFFSGHFYDDADVRTYKLQKSNDNSDQISDGFSVMMKILFFYSLCDNLLLNFDNDKGISFQNKNSLNKL